MKRNAILFATLCFLVVSFARVAAAQDAAKIAGTWEMTIQGGQGAVTQTLTIQQDGGKITGTLKGPRGESPLEGTVSGKTLSFTVKRQTPNGERIIPYTGTVDGDSMKGTLKFGDNDVDWTAKKSQ